MATSKTVKQAVAKATPRISAITAHDFGVKAGFRDQQKAGKITFRPIVGWVSVTNYVDAGKLPFVGVVLNDDNSPALAAKSVFPDFVGYFKNSASADDARKLVESEGVRVGGIRAAGRPVE